MKTRLTSSIDDKIIERAKKVAARRKESLSFVVEEHLEKYSKSPSSTKIEIEKPSFLERIRKYTKNVEPLPEDYDYKKVWHEHLDEKYGK